MHTNRKLSVLLVAVAVCVLSLPGLGQQSAKGKAAETATTALIQMHSAYQQASPAQKTQLLTQFQTLAAQRQQLLSSLIRTNPGDVLGVAIPGSISQRMPSSVKGYVEQDTVAQGTLEVAVEMSGNERDSRQDHWHKNALWPHRGPRETRASLRQQSAPESVDRFGRAGSWSASRQRCSDVIRCLRERAAHGQNCETENQNYFGEG